MYKDAHCNVICGDQELEATWVCVIGKENIK